MILMHHAAAKDDALWRKDTQQSTGSLRQIVSFEFPCRMVKRQFDGWFAPPRLDRGAACHTFEAVLVIGAVAFKVIAGMAAHRDMPDLRVHQAMQHLSIDDYTAANARADGD